MSSLFSFFLKVKRRREWVSKSPSIFYTRHRRYTPSICRVAAVLGCNVDSFEILHIFHISQMRICKWFGLKWNAERAKHEWNGEKGGANREKEWACKGGESDVGANKRIENRIYTRTRKSTPSNRSDKFIRFVMAKTVFLPNAQPIKAKRKNKCSFVVVGNKISFDSLSIAYGPIFYSEVKGDFRGSTLFDVQFLINELQVFNSSDECSILKLRKMVIWTTFENQSKTPVPHLLNTRIS